MKRIALVNPATKVSDVSESGLPYYRAFFEELSRLGYVEGPNLGLKRCSGEGRPERYAELARDVVNTHPDLILAVGAPSSLDFEKATTKIPIVKILFDPVSTCGKHRAGWQCHGQHKRKRHRCYCHCGIENPRETYGAAGRGNVKTVYRRLRCIATVLGKSTR